MKISKKIAAIILAVIMTFAMMPMTALAVEFRTEGSTTAHNTIDAASLNVGDCIHGSYTLNLNDRTVIMEAPSGSKVNGSKVTQTTPVTLDSNFVFSLYALTNEVTDTSIVNQGFYVTAIDNGVITLGTTMPGEGGSGASMGNAARGYAGSPYSQDEMDNGVSFSSGFGGGPSIGGPSIGGPSIGGMEPTYPEGIVAYRIDANGDKWYYKTLEDAVADSIEGETIKLYDDVDLSGKYDRSSAAHIFYLENRTLDLDGHTISTYNFAVAFSGDNMTITNGNFECKSAYDGDALSYAFAIFPEKYTRRSDAGCNLSAVSDKSTGVVLDGLTLNPGGANIKGADVTMKNCNVSATAYYAVWAQHDSNVKVESGTYTAGTNTVFGASNTAGEVAHIYVAGGNFVTNNSKALVLSSAGNVTIKGGFYHKADTSVYKVPAKYLADHCAQNMETGEVTQSAPNNQASLEVNETIVEDIYIDEDFYGAGATVTLYYNENSDASQNPQFVTETYEMSELPAVDGGRLISVPQAPAQATEPVKVKIYKAGQSSPETTIDTNAYSYCREIITGEYAANLKEVAESTLDYAAAAQLNFNYNTGDLANKDAPAGNDGYYNDVDGADLSGVAGFVSRPSNIRRGSIVVKSDLEINLFADYDIKVNSASLDTNRGGTRFAVATTGANGSYWAINVKGIEPANMNNTITVNTDSGKVEFTANTILKVLSNSSDAKLATLAKAAYLYGTATEEYFA